MEYFKYKKYVIFYNCSSLHSLPDISKWNILDKIHIIDMFDNCPSLSSFPDITKSIFYDFEHINVLNM